MIKRYLSWKWVDRVFNKKFLCNQLFYGCVFCFNCSSWILQTQFVQKVVSSFEDSMKDHATQAAIVTFDSSATIDLHYTYDKAAFSRKLTNIRQSGGGTNIALALERALSIVNIDANSRKNDEGVRKLIFLLTDGNGGAVETNAAKLKQIWK